jgi:hypothetical protein
VREHPEFARNGQAVVLLIMRMHLSMHPHQRYPVPEAMRVLQQMSRRLEDLQQMIVQEKNRLETSLAASPPSMLDLKIVEMVCRQGSGTSVQLGDASRESFVVGEWGCDRP